MKRSFRGRGRRSVSNFRRTHRIGHSKAHAHAAHVHRHHHNGTETSHLAFSLPQTSTCSVGWSYHSARRAICQVLFSLERENFVFLRKLKIVLDKSAACHYNDSCKPRWTVSSAGMSTCLTCMGSQVRVLYCPPYKNLETATVSPHRYTMCHRGTAGTGKSKTQAHAFEFASCFLHKDRA